MAVNMITSGFLLLVLVAGVQSAKVELGGDCTSASDQCVSTLAQLVCDTPQGKPTGVCRVKSSQPCKNAGGLCVVGALCDSGSGNCACATGYATPTGSGQCTPPNEGFYDSCTTASTDCPGTTLDGIDTAACGLKGGCQCASATTVPDYSNGKCIALANSMVGQACTSANAATNCGANSATHLSCVDTKCACDAGYFPTKTPGGTCVVNADSTVGKACTVGSTPSACTGQNEECVASKCACKSGFTAKPGGVCYAAWGTLKGGCLLETDCTGTDADKCTSYSSGPMTCKTEVTTVDGDCTDQTEKVCGPHLTCVSNKCKVAANYNGGVCGTPTTAFDTASCTGNTVCGAASPTVTGICVCDEGYEGVVPADCAIIAHMFGASCTGTGKGNCGDDSLVCTAGFCVCANGYSGGSPGDVCKSANSLGGACTTGSCTDTNAVCSGSSVCECKTDYVQSIFTPKCVLGVGGGTDCTSQTCVPGSTCDAVTKRCTCDNGYGPWTVDPSYCLPSTANVLGGACTITTTEAANTEKGTCTDANGKCRRDTGFCTCKAGYTASNFGQTCHASDAMMITTSSLLITLAAVISQLFVR